MAEKLQVKSPANTSRAARRRAGRCTAAGDLRPPPVVECRPRGTPAPIHGPSHRKVGRRRSSVGEMDIQTNGARKGPVSTPSVRCPGSRGRRKSIGASPRRRSLVTCLKVQLKIFTTVECDQGSSERRRRPGPAIEALAGGEKWVAPDRREHRDRHAGEGADRVAEHRLLRLKAAISPHSRRPWAKHMDVHGTGANRTRTCAGTGMIAPLAGSKIADVARCRSMPTGQACDGDDGLPRTPVNRDVGVIGQDNSGIRIGTRSCPGRAILMDRDDVSSGPSGID